MGVLTTLDFQDVHHTFIETGYGWGLSLENVVNYAFKELHSIEIDHGVYLKAWDRWKDEPRVTIHGGDSRAILPHLIEPANSTTFWLDAHYSGTVHYGESDLPGQCALLDELDVIRAVSWKAPITVLIDDIRLFTDEWWDNVRDTPNLRREEWPTLSQINERLEGFEVFSHVPDVLIARYHAS